MKKVTLPMPSWGIFAAVLLVRSLAHGEPLEPRSYETSYASIAKITRDLYDALDPQLRKQLNPQPALLQFAMPYAQPADYAEGSNTFGIVCISSGFVDLLNYFSHAKAIDGVDHGFFKKYLLSLSGESGEQSLSDLQYCSSRKTWAFNTMNHQVSHFNQIAGALIAINMAHHYLGHYQKYASQLVDAQNHSVPINSVLTQEEWREAVLKGARNALDCGLAVDGLKMFYDGLDKMSYRPAWSFYFLPKNADVAKIKKDLDQLERGFFTLK